MYEFCFREINVLLIGHDIIFLNYICCSNAVFAIIILETRLKLSQCDDLYIKENHVTNAKGY